MRINQDAFWEEEKPTRKTEKGEDIRKKVREQKKKRKKERMFMNESGGDSLRLVIAWFANFELFFLRPIKTKVKVNEKPRIGQFKKTFIW